MTKRAEKLKRVAAIKYGTVIDHIPPESTFRVLHILNLGNESITVGNNLFSKKMGLKGLVKISDKILTREELSKIAIMAPAATVCTIADYEVKEKFKVELPEELNGILKCFNPQCVTRHETAPTRFYLLRKRPLRVKCHYCERAFGKDEILLDERSRGRI